MAKFIFVLVFDLILYICICNWIYLYLSLYLITNICICNCRTEVCSSGVWGKVLPRHNFLTIPNSYFSSGPTGMRNFESNFSFEDGNLIMLNALTAGALRNPSIGSFPPFMNSRRRMMNGKLVRSTNMVTYHMIMIDHQYGFIRMIDHNTFSSAGSWISGTTWSPKYFLHNSV